MDYSPSLLSTRMIYVTTILVQTWRSLCSTSPLFSKGRITASKEVNHYKLGHVSSFSYADGEIVGLVNASRRERDVTYETWSLSHCVFSAAFNWTIAQ